MTLSVTLVSENDQLLRLVRDFAHGLGCPVTVPKSPDGRGRIEVDDDDHSLVELLTHVALSAAKAGVNLAEPVCHVTYQHRSVTSEVTLTLRIAEFRIDTGARVGTKTALQISSGFDLLVERPDQPHVAMAVTTANRNSHHLAAIVSSSDD